MLSCGKVGVGKEADGGYALHRCHSTSACAQQLELVGDGDCFDATYDCIEVRTH